MQKESDRESGIEVGGPTPLPLAEPAASGVCREAEEPRVALGMVTS